MLPRLYAIVDADVCRARGVAAGEVARGLAGAGVRLVQWRNKGGSPAEVLAGAQEIRAAFQGVAGARLMMNDRVDLALLAGFNGVHVGQGDLSPTDVRRVMRAVGPTRGPRQEREELDTEGFVVGVSTHTAAEVEAAEVSGADYVAVGPVFATGDEGGCCGGGRVGGGAVGAEIDDEAAGCDRGDYACGCPKCVGGGGGFGGGDFGVAGGGAIVGRDGS